MQKVIPKLQSRVSQSREKGINIMEKIQRLMAWICREASGRIKMDS